MNPLPIASAPVKATLLPSFKLDLRFDALRMQAELDKIVPADYVPHFNTGYYTGNWSVVPLRSIGGAVNQVYPDPTKTDQYADTPLLARCHYLREIVEGFKCPLQAVRLLRLTAGSVIKEHRDFKLSFEEGELRLHIPITTNPDVDFIVAGRRVVMEPGECWYNNFSLPHSVVNRGPTDRIHLVIDCAVNDWLTDLFRRSLARSGG